MSEFGDIFQASAKEVKKADKVVNQAASDCMNTAKICFGLKQFSEYKQQYLAAEAKMIGAMTALTESYIAGNFDLNAYGARMLVYMTRLKDLRLLLDVVNSDIRRGEKNG